ncbi:MAG: hypothetical protein GTO02_21415 [Candidatus Dadabacteria bacterium]|nr:hypothetical protein [Candidatus Dadabacteria bacterium]NIQ16843.1 hypothetical protein [Candidatus Dadabacteria bacterium]
MECQSTEKYIVDYFTEEQSGDLDIELFNHLNSCNDCRELFKQFENLLYASKIDSYEEPRREILERIQHVARINSPKSIKKESVLKKMFYTPVLVPVFGAVMVFMILVNVSNDGINYLNQSAQLKTQMDSDTKISKKDTENKKINELNEKKQETNNDLELRSDPPNGPSPRITVSTVNEELPILNRNKQVFIKNVGNELFSVESTLLANAKFEIPSTYSSEYNNYLHNNQGMERTDNNYEYTENARKSVNVPMDDVIEVASAVSVDSDIPLIELKDSTESRFDENENINYSNITNTKIESCNNRINESLNVLSKEPLSSFPVRKKAYINLAECYEVQSKWRNAVESYYYLINLDKDNYDLYSERINYIEKNYLP